MVPSLKVERHDNGERLDALLARTYPQYSRAFFQKFMRKGGVTLSGAPREPSYRVRVGETFHVADFEAFHAEPDPRQNRVAPVDFVPEILFEDAALLVINKPAGLVVHPAPGHRVGTLMDWLRGHLGTSVVKVFTDPERLGLVHRLDKDTSGVLVIAKSVVSQTAISRQFHDRTVQKTYAAFVEGIPASKTGVINAPVGRSRKVATRMAISPLGRAAETTFEVVETMKEVSLVTLHPKTGRTHQLRVHLSAIGHPIVGDRTYGSKSVWGQTYGISRPLLHAERLQINHPASGKRVSFSAPWPDDLHKAQTLFRKIFSVLIGGVLAGGLAVSSVRAEEAAPHKAAVPSSSSSRSSSSGSGLGSDVRKMKRDLAEIKEDMSGMSATLDKLNADNRIRDLEHAVAELNSRAVGGSTSGEETKTLLLDIGRKLKTQQDALEQLRDQFDRINRQVIQLQAAVTAARAVAPSEGQAPPAATTKPQGSKY